MKKIFMVFLGIYCLAIVGNANAYVPKVPDVGTLLRETEKQKVEVKSEGSEVYKAASTKKIKKGVTIKIKGFKFIGDKVLPKVELEQLLKNYIGKDVDISELDLIVGKIAEFYAKKNYIVKVLLPEQEIKNGIIEVKIIMGKLEAIKVIGKKNRFNQKFASEIVSSAQPTDKIIHIDRLERGMLILNDTPGVHAQSLLCPGKKEGGVMVDLDVKDTPLVSGSLGYDNYGLHSTGTNRGVASIHLNDPFTIGDQISGTLIYTGLMYYGSLAYSVPVGYDGVRFGLTTGYLDYRLGKEYSALHSYGNAFTAGPYISYPLIRARMKNLYLLLNYHHKKLANAGELIGSSTRKVDVATVYLNGDAYDSFLSGGYTSGGLGFSLGDINYKDNLTAAINSKTQGEYTKLTFLSSRIQRLTDETALNLKIAGQVALHNLDSSEQFDIGGPDGVKAYAPGDVYGDHGLVAVAELSRKLRGGFKIAGFYDFGYIRQRFKTYPGWQGVETQRNGYALDAVGASLYWTPKSWFFAKVSVATAALLRNHDINKPQDFRGGIGRYSRVLLQVAATF